MSTTLKIRDLPVRQTAVYEKYGEAAVAGFQPLPDLLLKNQHRLKLSPTDLVVLLNVLMHWWYADQKPFVRPTAIGRRMGVATRTAQRSISRLRALGLLEQKKSEAGPMILDPTPLVERLCRLAPMDPDYMARTKPDIAA